MDLSCPSYKPNVSHNVGLGLWCLTLRHNVGGLTVNICNTIILYSCLSNQIYSIF